MAEIKRVLGIDFGQSKIGLATADLETKMAFAFGVLKNNGEFWKKIKEICQKECIERIIVGIPSHRMNSGGVENAKIFGNRIENETGVSVEYEEEMFTTKLAQENLLQTGAREVSKKDDAESARIILQSWLDRKAL